MTIADVKFGRISVRTLKGAYTAFIGTLATKMNAGGAITRADMTSLILDKYDPVTVTMNDLGEKIDALPDVMFSPNGGAALPPVGQIVDGAGDLWSFGASAGGEDFAVTRNSSSYFGNVACLIAVYDGKIWLRDSLNNWWTRDATNKFVTSVMSPYGTSKTDVRSFNTHDGATIAASSPATAGAPSAFLIDMNAAKWTFGAQAANGHDFIILRNGLPFSQPGFTTKPYEALMLRLKNGVVWMQNAAGSWVYPPL